MLILWTVFLHMVVLVSSQWVQHDGVDCYSGKGAEPIQPDPFSSSVSLARCQAVCMENPQCEGIIRKKNEGDGEGICYLRKSISLSGCAEDPTWTLHQVWVKHDGLDCYQGKGGDPLQPDPFSNSVSLGECKAACRAQSTCEGVIRKSGDQQNNGICYLRKNINLHTCVTDSTWTLHQKAKGSSPTRPTRPTSSPSTSRPSSFGCKSGIQGYPRSLPNSHYYTRLCNTNQNLKIVSANRASAAAIERTAYLIGNVMAYVDPRVARSMNARGFRHAVMGNYPSELTTHIPEHAFLDPGYWNERARGLGATVAVPVGSSAEENAMCYSNDRYRGEDITIHEFAHSMHLLGFALVFPNFNSELTGLYNGARSYNLWGSGHYAMTDFKEYFAEGVQSYFDTNAADSVAPTTREALRRKDPNLFNFLQRYIGNNPWKRRCP